MASATRHKQQEIRKHLRAGKRHAKGSNLNSDINVTPLVDVVLVLLIIFMVVTPMITSGVQVDLPRTANHFKKPDNGKDIIVSVTKQKIVFFAGRPIAIKELPRVIEEEKRRFPEKTVFVKGDSMTTYGTVRDVMEAINKTGVEDVMLGTDEIKTVGGPPSH
jgi:biopolymer transport protein ExbD/biopolymer transport protein TolR